VNRAVFELSKEKRDALEELEKTKVDLAIKDDDVKATMDARDEDVKEMKHLMGQVEGVKAVAVSNYQASKAFEDNNLRFFYLVLKLSENRPKENYLEIDFSMFQSYDDTKSVNDDGGKGGDGDQTDDATS
jgi:hypothetical protein